MPTASLRCFAASVALHTLLLGVAALGATSTPRHAPTVLIAPLEAAIAVDAANPLGDFEPVSAAPAASRQPAAAPPAAAMAAPRKPPARRSIPVKEPSPVPLPAAEAPPVTRTPTVSPASMASPGSAPPHQSPVTSLDAAARSPTPSVSPVAGSSSGGLGAGPVARSGGEGGAPAATATDGRARLLASYLKGVRERVVQHREYPYLARRAKLEGTICLRVVVGASGRVLGVTPTCGMTQQPLLEAALASVSSAAPFPPLPAALGPRLTVDVPVVFELDPL